MDVDASCSPPSLRRKLRTTVCGCFGSAGSAARWRRRQAAAGEFRYDPLSYALNFDDGDNDDQGEDVVSGVGLSRHRDFNSRLPHSPAPAAVAIA